ncbi:MAG: hypothetical protein DWI67_02415 [Chloroflexi bacterium]|nr:MAG: hypothetical protein DWI67_02415 [Chloroflexota bacterium]
MTSSIACAGALWRTSICTLSALTRPTKVSPSCTQVTSFIIFFPLALFCSCATGRCAAQPAHAARHKL